MHLKIALSRLLLTLPDCREEKGKQPKAGRQVGPPKSLPGAEEIQASHLLLFVHEPIV